MMSSQRRVAAVAALSAVILLSLAAIVYTEHADATATVAVWELTHDVQAGALYSAADVEQVQIGVSDAGSNYEESGPQALAARYASNLAAHDILRIDDLVPAGQQAEVAITVVDPPPVQPGDHIDVFATVNADTQALIGRNIIVEAVDGESLTILVPASDESSWVAIAAATVSLHVARTDGQSRTSGSPQSANDAIQILCGAACAGLPPAPSASP